MFSIGYFTTPGITIPGGGGGSGTGLTPEQTAQLADLKTFTDNQGGPDYTMLQAMTDVYNYAISADTKASANTLWRTTVVPSKYGSASTASEVAASQAEWAKVVASDQLQTGTFVSAEPNDKLVNEGTFLSVLSGYNNSISNVLAIANSKTDDSVFQAWKIQSQPTYVWIPHTVSASSPMVLNTGAPVAHAVYHCNPMVPYTGYTYAVLQISFPSSLTSFEFTVLNRSTSGVPVRLFCTYRATDATNKTYAAFRRGMQLSAVWSCSLIQAGQAVRFVFHPESDQWYFRGGATSPGGMVAGFDEFDVDADESRTLIPVNNT